MKRAWVLVLVAVLAATSLRFFRLEAQSYWNDEGNSRVQASRAWAEIVANTAADIHPPGYYLALSAWRGLLGESEFGLRSFSALAGVLVVALTARVARHWGGWRAGVVAAMLAAGHPFLIYYSQEARMYAWLGVWAVAAFWALGRWAHERHGWRWGAAYAALTAAGLYTHYAYGFIILAHGALVLGWLAWGLVHRQPVGPRLWAWLAAQAAALLLFAPWLPTALHQLLNWPAARATTESLTMLADLGRTLWLGRMLPLTESMPLTLGLTLGLVVALAVHRPRWPGGGLALAWLAVPAGLTLALGLLTEAFAKFLLVAVPSLIVLAALTWGPAPRRAVVPAALMLAWLAALYPALNNLYFNPAYARDDYRAIARQVADLYRLGDAVALVSPNQAEAYLYYHTAPAPVHPLPRTRPPEPAAIHAQLAELARTHSRLFVLFWGEQQADPQGLIETWLNANAFKAGDQWFGNVRLATYALAQPAAAPQVLTETGFGEVLTLTGYALNASAYAPGDIAQVTLFWQATAPVPTRYKVFVHLSPAFDVPPLAQHDGEPAGGSRPTDTWPVGEVIADNHGLLIPPDTPPGTYRLLVGVYGLFDGTRLPTTTGDRLDLGLIRVQMP